MCESEKSMRKYEIVNECVCVRLCVWGRDEKPSESESSESLISSEDAAPSLMTSVFKRTKVNQCTEK